MSLWMISKRHHARISKRKSVHDLYFKPDPLVTHSESRTQIQSYLSRFIPSNKKAGKDKLLTGVTYKGGEGKSSNP